MSKATERNWHLRSALVSLMDRIDHLERRSRDLEEVLRRIGTGEVEDPRTAALAVLEGARRNGATGTG